MKLKTITNENARKIKGKIAQAVICAETRFNGTADFRYRYAR